MASSSNNNTNVENITNKVATVALDDEEIEVEDTDFHEEQSVTKYDLRFALVGRFLTERFIRLNEMSQVMAANWRPGMGISIQEIYPQRFLFQFGHEADIRRIQESGPWAYDNHPLIFERVAQGDNLDKVDLNELAMWIQLHDLPAGWWSNSIGRKIGSRLGEFLESDPNNYLGARKDYMRIRIKFDVLKPLKKMINMKKPKGEDMIQVTIWYERLPTYCFQCGMLGHGEKFCHLNYATEEGVSVSNYGPELRALPRRATQLRIGEK